MCWVGLFFVLSGDRYLVDVIVIDWEVGGEFYGFVMCDVVYGEVLEGDYVMVCCENVI